MNTYCVYNVKESVLHVSLNRVVLAVVPRQGLQSNHEYTAYI